MEQKTKVFHLWEAKLDVAARTVSFYVSKEFRERVDQLADIDRSSPDLFDLVMVLPFPPEQERELENGTPVSYAANPTFFDHEQLSKRYIQEDEFVRTIERLVESINKDLEAALSLEKLAEESEWSL